MNSTDENQSTVTLPKTKLTTAIKLLQDMFPNLNTAIIDRSVITANGDVNVAIEKLLLISSRFS